MFLMGRALPYTLQQGRLTFHCWNVDNLFILGTPRQSVKPLEANSGEVRFVFKSF